MWRSCGVTHENIFFIYGGFPNERQVLQLIDCGLSSIGTLPFDYAWGACDSSNGLILLCFDINDTKQCRQATTPLGPWSEMTPSTYDHRATQIATSPGIISCKRSGRRFIENLDKRVLNIGKSKTFSETNCHIICKTL